MDVVRLTIRANDAFNLHVSRKSCSAGLLGGQRLGPAEGPRLSDGRFVLSVERRQ